MTKPNSYKEKSTVAEIRERFDQDVERFAVLATGQSATMDAPLVMALLSAAAVSATPAMKRVLDVGCGAGNNTIRLRETLGRDIDIDLLDLSTAMTARASERLKAVNGGRIASITADIRDAELPVAGYDVILAAAVLHHLRDEDDWRQTFARLYGLLAPGGSLWISDLVAHEDPTIQAMMWARYSAYLDELGGLSYRDKVLDYIEREDSPRPLTYQLDLLREVGFSRVEVLHKNCCFAAFGGIKAPLH